jgi:hypothetical protein
VSYADVIRRELDTLERGARQDLGRDPNAEWLLRHTQTALRTLDEWAAESLLAKEYIRELLQLTRHYEQALDEIRRAAEAAGPGEMRARWFAERAREARSMASTTDEH